MAHEGKGKKEQRHYVPAGRFVHQAQQRRQHKNHMQREGAGRDVIDHQAVNGMDQIKQARQRSKNRRGGKKQKQKKPQ